MNIQIVFREKDWLKLTGFLVEDKINESGAIAFCKVLTSNRLKRFLVNKVIKPWSTDYRTRTPGFVGFGPEFMEQCFQYCEQNGLHLIDIHTHPFSHDVHFSAIDDREDSGVKGPHISEYVPGVELLFMVHGLNPEDLDARMWNKDNNSLEAINLIKIL